jgi:hypothetical protein
MRTVTLDLPVLGFLISTRAALAAGIGLLLAERLSMNRRRLIGVTLVAIGAATTMPAVMLVRRQIRRSHRVSSVSRDEQLIGATRLPRKGDDEV